MEKRTRSPGRPKRSVAVVNQKPTTKPVTSSGRKSPSRKSPARKASPEKVKEKITNESTNMQDKSRSSPAKNLKVRLEKTSVFMQSIQITQNRNFKASTDTIDIGSQSISLPPPPPQTMMIPTTKFEDTSGDSEIAKITSIPPLATRRSTSVTKLTPTTLTSTQRLTSTPSVTGTMTDQLSRQSRSASRSVYEASKTEYSDNEDDEIIDDRNIEDDGDDNGIDKRSTSSYSNYHQTRGISNFLRNSFGISKSDYNTGVNNYISRQYFTLPKEFGGVYGSSLILILLPIITYYLQWSCDTTNDCTIKMISLPSIENLRTKILSINYFSELFEEYFTKDAIYGYILYTFGIFLISSIIRIGYHVNLPSQQQNYHFNTLCTSIIVTIGLIISEILQWNITDFILKNYIKFMLYNILNAFILSIWLYIRSYYIPKNFWNPYGNTGNFIQDLSIGREINPKWFNIVNIKLFYYRLSIITTLIILETIIIKNLHIPKLPIIPTSIHESTSSSDIISITDEITISLTKTIDIMKYYSNNINYRNGSALFITILMLIYLFDTIIYEHHLSISFELQYEGVGALLLLRYALQPFLLCSLPKYANDKKLSNPSVTIMLLTTIICVIGIIMKRSSMRMKYLYRLDPYRKEFLYMDTVPTFQGGKRLLLGKLWGTVRQPNYTGDLISLLSFQIVLLLNNKFSYIPFIMLSLIIINLLYRAYRVHLRNSARYNTAWHRYCAKVRYMMIPKIY